MVVGNLEKLGLARRQSCPEDRRVLIVALTAKGKTLLRDIFPRHAAAIVGFLGVLSTEEQERLGDLCRKLGKQARFSVLPALPRKRSAGICPWALCRP